MNILSFVKDLSTVSLENVFNPYKDLCPIHDRIDAPKIRRENLRSLLGAVGTLNIDTLWMGRDLGYRGGRRTGLALTDEAHLVDVEKVYLGASAKKATTGVAVAERTAAEIWAVIGALKKPPMLWNVFPFHPHSASNVLSNRKFSSAELSFVSDLNRELINWVKPRLVIAIGQDAGNYARTFCNSVETIRHPSYGGVTEFRAGMVRLYGARNLTNQKNLFG